MKRPYEERASIPNIGPDTAAPPSLLLARSLKESWRSYRRLLHRFQKGHGGRRVHKLRIEARRLLTNLELLTPMIPGRAVLKAHAVLRKQFLALGALRDAQVQLRLFDRPPLNDRKLRLVRNHFRKRAKRLTRPVVKIKDAKLARLIESVLRRLASVPDTGSLNHELLSGINRARRAALGEVNSLMPRCPKDLVRLHLARIAIKRYRFVGGILEQAGSDGDARLPKRLRSQQAQMGEIHDIELFLARLEKWAAKKMPAGNGMQKALASLERRRAVLTGAYFRSAKRVAA